MEEVKQKMSEEKRTMITIFIVGGAYILGCMVGSAKMNKVSIDSYKRGVYDTLEAIILKPEQ